MSNFKEVHSNTSSIAVLKCKGRLCCSQGSSPLMIHQARELQNSACFALCIFHSQLSQRGNVKAHVDGTRLCEVIQEILQVCLFWQSFPANVSYLCLRGIHWQVHPPEKMNFMFLLRKNENCCAALIMGRLHQVTGVAWHLRSGEISTKHCW